MKTYTGLRATLAALCAFVMLSILGFGPSRVEAGQVENSAKAKSFASHTAPPAKAEMDAGTITNVSVVPAANMAAARAGYGLIIESRDGGEGAWHIDRISYDFEINGSPALDINGVAITDKALEVYLNPQSGSGPYLRGFRADGTTVVTGHGASAPVANSNLSNCKAIYLEGLNFDPTGSVRRPRPTGPGWSYMLRFHAQGTYKGAPFNITEDNVAWVLTSPTAPSPLSIECFSDTSVDLKWIAAPGATGYRLEKSLNDGSNWETVATLPANATTAVVTNLDVAGTGYQFRVIALGVGSSAGDSAPAGPVGPNRIVSNAIVGGQFVVTVHGSPFDLSNMQFSGDLAAWESAPGGTVLGGSGFTHTVSIPMGPSRFFARVKPCMQD